MDTWLLIAGMVAVFSGLVLAVLVVAKGSRERADLRASLATVGTYHVTGPSAPRPEILGFDERVLVPALARATRIGNKITPAGRVAAYGRMIELAGRSETWDASRVLAWKAIGLVAGVPAAWLLSQVLGLGGVFSLALLVGGGVLGYFAVDLWLVNSRMERQERIRRSLPDAIDLMTIAVEAGLAFDGAMIEVSRNMEGPLADESLRALQEMQLGLGRGQALQSMADRTEVAELNAFVGAVIQADKYGVPIAQVLRVQSQEMRTKRRQLAEEKAQKVPIKILFPLAVCILPAMFIVLLGPAGITIYDTLIK